MRPTYSGTRCVALYVLGASRPTHPRRSLRTTVRCALRIRVLGALRPTHSVRIALRTPVGHSGPRCAAPYVFGHSVTTAAPERNNPKPSSSPLVGPPGALRPAYSVRVALHPSVGHCGPRCVAPYVSGHSVTPPCRPLRTSVRCALRIRALGASRPTPPRRLLQTSVRCVLRILSSILSYAF